MERVKFKTDCKFKEWYKEETNNIGLTKMYTLEESLSLCDENEKWGLENCKDDLSILGFCRSGDGSFSHIYIDELQEYKKEE